MFQNYYTFIFIILLFLGMFLFFNGLITFSRSLNSYKNLSLFKKINSSSKFIIILYGFLFSSIIQSSSICISIIIPLIGIGVLSIQSCFYLIIGFNIGTVSSLFFTGLNTNFCSLILFIISFILLIIYIIRKNNKYYILSNLLFGLTLIFLGLSTIKTSFIFFKTTSLYSLLLNNLSKNYFHPFLIGLFLSSIIQSGSIISTTFQLMYVSTDIHLIYVILVILGSNLGSTITGILASIYYDHNAKIVAYFHVLLNLLGVLLTLSIFTPFYNLVIYITQLLKQKKGFEIAVTHLLFNTFASILILPFINKLQKTLSNYTK